MKQRVLLFVAVFVLAACARETKPVDRESSSEPAPVYLDQAGAAETLAMAEQLLGESVVVEAKALASLPCIRVTVKEPTPQPRHVAAELLLGALRAQGLRIQRVGAGWVVSVDKAHPLAKCESDGRGPAANRGADAGSEASPVRARPAASGREEVLDTIREISPTEHVITQRGLDLVLEDEQLWLRSARFVPEVVAGKTVGLRLFGVRPDGLLGRLGCENGDLVERLMGRPVGTPEQMSDARAAMRGAKVIDVEIVRRGERKKLIIRVE